jgi:raffinose/stachyose/melibiose transport system permease protein
MTAPVQTFSTSRQKPKSLWREIQRNAWVYAFLAPMLVLFTLFTLWPMLATMYFSFFDWDGTGTPSDFVGLENFAKSISSPFFWGAFGNSALYTLLLAALNLPLTFFLALLLNQSWLRARVLYRTMFFLPVVTTTAVIGVIATLIIGQNFGPLNELLSDLGLARVQLLSNPNTALLTIIVVNFWKSFGYNLVYWLAGLQSIPKDLYEAAELDGAVGWNAVRYITLPMLAPIAAVILLLQLIAGLTQFDLVWTMTQGGPDFSSEVMTTHIYRLAFANSSTGQYGLASAAALFFGFATMIVAITQSMILRTLRGKSGA